MNKSGIAAEYFSNGSACSQSIAAVFSEDTGLDPSLAHKFTTGFGGGMGRKKYTCDVVTGAVFVLSAKYGSSSSDEVENKAQSISLTAEFLEAFESRQGSSSCRDLLASACVRCVRVAAEELERIL